MLVTWEGAMWAWAITAATDSRHIYMSPYVHGLTENEKSTMRLPCTLLSTLLSTQSPSINHRLANPRQNLPIAQWPYEQPQRHDLGWMDHICPHCGALYWLLGRLAGDRNNQTLLFMMHCNWGEIWLPAIIPPPVESSYLLLHNSNTTSWSAIPTHSSI